MKTALVQSRIIWEDKAANIAKLEDVISENPDTELFLLPEMSFTGFSMNTAVTGDSGDETVSEIRKFAVRYGVSVGFGWVRRMGVKCGNVYTVIDRDGRILSEYVKTHPFSFSGEDRYFTRGDRLSVYRIGDIPFSTFICYDLRFPEIFRAVCRDVHAVIIPANWPEKRSEHWKTLLRARAIENQVYILAVNCFGEMNGMYYSGDSCIIAPDGNVLMSLSGREGVIKYDFNDDTEKYRRAFPVLQDMRTGFRIDLPAGPFPQDPPKPEETENRGKESLK